MDTPCVQICVIDAVSGYCIGCGRSPAEIASWSRLPGDQRRLISQALPTRLSAMTARSARRRGRRRRQDSQAGL